MEGIATKDGPGAWGAETPLVGISAHVLMKRRQAGQAEKTASELVPSPAPIAPPARRPGAVTEMRKGP